MQLITPPPHTHTPTQVCRQMQNLYWTPECRLITFALKGAKSGSKCDTHNTHGMHSTRSDFVHVSGDSVIIFPIQDPPQAPSVMHWHLLKSVEEKKWTGGNCKQVRGLCIHENISI